MDLICNIPWPNTTPSSDGPPHAATAAAAALWSGFREDEVSMLQLADVLRAVGLEQHWTAATGLPALPAG